jgi:UDP:flavonoid glycosyltransferase YjiC (YdhE family)
VRGYVPKLYEHLDACDVAVVQGEGTTTLELTALRRPFLHFPLEGHCEQEVAVAGRLARHGAGVRMTLSQTTPEMLAERVAVLVGTEPDYPAIACDGARRAAEVALRLADARP